jgi:hypothetical protein
VGGAGDHPKSYFAYFEHAADDFAPYRAMKTLGIEKKISRVLLLLCLLSLTACLRVGDSVTNATDGPLRVEIYDSKGKVYEFFGKDGALQPYFEMPAGVTFYAKKGTPDRDSRFSRIVAFTEAGAKVGELDIRDVPNSRGRYGKNISVIILADGVFPVPKEQLGKLDSSTLRAIMEEEKGSYRN